MAITTLDSNTALVVIDLQNGIVAYPTVHAISDIVKNASILADEFRRHGLPVVLVNVDGRAPGRTEQSPRLPERSADWADIVSELKQQPQDHTVTKRTWGAFTHTDLETYLKRRGITQLVIVGVSTSAGVESTARHAYELGFNITLAVDALTDMNADAHNNSIGRIFPRIGETGTTGQIIELLDQRSA